MKILFIGIQLSALSQNSPTKFYNEFVLVYSSSTLFILEGEGELLGNGIFEHSNTL